MVNTLKQFVGNFPDELLSVFGHFVELALKGLKHNKESKDYKRLFFVEYLLMINIRNLGSKESLGVKFKDSMSTALCLKFRFERDWYFCNIESGWF